MTFPAPTKKRPAAKRRRASARPTAAQFYAVLVYRLSLAILATIVILHVKGG